jgi:hypothetical protein
MRYHYTFDDIADDLRFGIVDAKLGIDNPIAYAAHRDHAELIVKALNAVYDGPFALDAIPNCVIKEIT